jgi:hypothetical protein
MLGGESSCSQGLLCFISRLPPGDAQDKSSLVPCGSCCGNAVAIVPTHVDALTRVQEIKLHDLQMK